MPRGCATNSWRRRRVRAAWKANQKSEADKLDAIPNRPAKPKQHKRCRQKRGDHVCPRCNLLATEYRTRRFANGMTHIELRCGPCDKHIKFVSHRDVDLTQVID